MRHTQIIATVGPACDTVAMLDALMAEGSDIFRLNFTARRLSLYRGVRPMRTGIGENVDWAGTLVGCQLVARGLVARGAAVVLVGVGADLTRPDANYLKLQRL